MLLTALNAASTTPSPVEHEIFSSPSKEINFTVTVGKPIVPCIT